ncbi:uncharacterized protein LOC118436981 [Folsomia candida]|uniref:uncharacterized protein LOC118436981 n=1 Tax=Folsomia candida TaxID=158441 RepID=UPI001604CFB0|nr:uncharacterized protein LOC118436981 [Folsomia candida]
MSTVLPEVLNKCENMVKKPVWKLTGYLHKACSHFLITVFTLVSTSRCFIEFILYNPNENEQQFFHTKFHNDVISLKQTLTRKIPWISYFYDDLTTDLVQDNVTSDWSDVLLGCFDILSNFAGILIPFCGDWFTLVIAFTLWVPSYHFYKVVEEDKLVVPEILEMYEDLKTLSDLMNVAFSKIMLPYAADVMFFYATHLLDIVASKTSPAKLYLALAFLVVMLTILLLADASRRTDGLRKWLMKRHVRKAMENDPLLFISLTQDAASHPVGLSGDGIFIYNYNFVFGILNTLLTIFILCVQFQHTDKQT